MSIYNAGHIADKYFSGGKTYEKVNSIANTSADKLYQTERFGNFSYNIPVTNGDYKVTLRFAELYFSSGGKRVFDVKAEGKTILNDFDIYKAAGGKFKAVNRTHTITVNDERLNLQFISVVNNAKVSAITIEKLVSNQAPVVKQINDIIVDVDGRKNTFVDASDPQVDSLSYRLLGEPSFVTRSGRYITMAPKASHEGSYDIVAEVKDSKGNASTETYKLIVQVEQQANQAPKINAIADVTMTEGQSKTINVVASDADGDSLVLSFAKAMPSFIKLVGNEIQVDTVAGDAGQYGVTVVAEDGKGGSDTEYFDLKINEDTSADDSTGYSKNADYPAAPYMMTESFEDYVEPWNNNKNQRWKKEGQNMPQPYGPALKGSRSLKAYIKRELLVNSTQRSELNFMGKPNDTRFRAFPFKQSAGYRVAIYVPSDYQKDPTREIIIQLHNIPDQIKNGQSCDDKHKNPPLNIRVENGEVGVQHYAIDKYCGTNDDKKNEVKGHWTGFKLVPGKWHFFVLDFNIDYRNSGNGFFKVYVSTKGWPKSSDMIYSYQGPFLLDSFNFYAVNKISIIFSNLLISSNFISFFNSNRFV
jgi:hypothetical protein